MLMPERRAFKWYTSLLPSCRHILVSQNLSDWIGPRRVLPSISLNTFGTKLDLAIEVLGGVANGQLRDILHEE